MKKYFKEDQTKKLKLSEYLKLGESASEYYICDEKYIRSRIKYIMEIIGDAELDEDTYRLFMEEFDCCGGRYDVRTKRETIQGIYDISQKYPFLSAEALDTIWFVYIRDQFDEYALDEALGEFIELYGKTEEALSRYIDYVDKTAKVFDKRFHKDATKLSVYCKEYDYDLIQYLQCVIKRQHISLEKIISSLPSRELIDKDQKQLRKIVDETRIYFGACPPISYQMIESLATDEGLGRYPEQPKYLICETKTVDTTFTKQEFLDSIKERIDKQQKQKVLK